MKSVAKIKYSLAILFYIAGSQLRSQPLNGVYTIGKFSCNYSTIQSAVDDLIANGISGNVTFNIRPGIYKETIEIPKIMGAGEGDSIIFQSIYKEKSSKKVMLINDGNSAYVLSIKESKGLTFSNLTLSSTSTHPMGCVIMIHDGSDYINFIRNEIRTDNNSEGSNTIALIRANRNLQADFTEKGIVFTRNLMYGGSYGYNGGTLKSPFLFLKNRVYQQKIAAFSTYDFSTFKAIDNMIEAHIERTEHSVEQTPNTTFYFAFLSFGNSNFITNNKIRIESNVKNARLWAFDFDAANYGFVANNFISITGKGYAEGLRADYGSQVQFIHNNIYMNTDISYGINSGQEIMNNNIFIDGEGCAIENGIFIYNSKNNNLYNPNSTLLCLNNENHEINSISVDPQYISKVDLHVSNPLLNGAGIPHFRVTHDIDGERRDATTPDIGADEFHPQVKLHHLYELKIDNLIVFPNPTSGETRLIYENPQSSPMTLQILNSTGKILEEFRYNSAFALNLNVRNYQFNFLLIRLITKDAVIAKKLWIK